jgi:hypothetical protein
MRESYNPSQSTWDEYFLAVLTDRCILSTRYFFYSAVILSHATINVNCKLIDV